MCAKKILFLPIFRILKIYYLCKNIKHMLLIKKHETSPRGVQHRQRINSNKMEEINDHELF